jgi:hypothetical protein
LVQSGEVEQFTKETETVFIEVDANRDALMAALERRGVVVMVDGSGLTIEGPDESVYDHVRDALVKAQAPVRRMAPRRRALSELFEREETVSFRTEPRRGGGEESSSSRQRGSLE